MSTFSERLHELLVARNMTQTQLAEAADLTEVTISRYATGKQVPNIDRAARIAEALSASLDWMCGVNGGGE